LLEECAAVACFFLAVARLVAGSALAELPVALCVPAFAAKAQRQVSTSAQAALDETLRIPVTSLMMMLNCLVQMHRKKQRAQPAQHRNHL
jgi:hypothetical protein